MIERDIKTKITEQNFSLDSNIILFKGDGRIDFRLIIEDKRYKYDNVYTPTYYNFTIISPNSKELFYLMKVDKHMQQEVMEYIIY